MEPTSYRLALPLKRKGGQFPWKPPVLICTEGSILTICCCCFSKRMCACVFLCLYSLYICRQPNSLGLSESVKQSTRFRWIQPFYDVFFLALASSSTRLSLLTQRLASFVLDDWCIRRVKPDALHSDSDREKQRSPFNTLNHVGQKYSSKNHEENWPIDHQQWITTTALWWQNAVSSTKTEKPLK